MKNVVNNNNLRVQVYDHAMVMGIAAADFVEKKLNQAIRSKGAANLLLATGSSQFSFLEALRQKKLDWQKIVVFHLDEYKGISSSHPASFRKYLKDRILNSVNPKRVYFLNGDAEDLENEMALYQRELTRHPIDIACIGIGENGHIAFTASIYCYLIKYRAK